MSEQFDLKRSGDLMRVAGTRLRQAELTNVVARLRRDTDPDRVRWAYRAILQPEPSNPHDPNAVMVKIHGYHVGYVPAELTGKFLPLLNSRESLGMTTTCAATVSVGKKWILASLDVAMPARLIR